MTSLVHNMTLNDCAVTIVFDWYGDDEPEWDTMVVQALLPSADTPEGKHLVKVNDLLSPFDWDAITDEIYWNQEKIRSQQGDWL